MVAAVVMRCDHMVFRPRLPPAELPRAARAARGHDAVVREVIVTNNRSIELGRPDLSYAGQRFCVVVIPTERAIWAPGGRIHRLFTFWRSNAV